MMMTLSLLLFLFQSTPSGEGKGFVVERDVELLLVDPLDRQREIHRRERISYQEGNLLIEDLTFGEKLLIRTDQKAVWVIDTLAGTWSRRTTQGGGQGRHTDSRYLRRLSTDAVAQRGVR